MDERADIDTAVDELMLPGFRFHPTDEELVGFYLTRKIQKKPLSIELIKQLDIYKYNPWDLPNLATTGEKEWYFYCLRDRKYRNSARPNRVTGAGFWKATGTDRPVYSSEQPKCIGLKKSLVFYKGRAAKGIKTDWMMHEFRLPSLADSSSPNSISDRNNSANDSWAICRIFKKANSMAQRALAHSWIAPLQEKTEPEMFSVSHTPFYSENTSSTTTEARSIQFGLNSGLQQEDSAIDYSPQHATTYKRLKLNDCKSSLLPFSSFEVPPNFMSSPDEIQMPSECKVDVGSIMFNLSPTACGDIEQVSATINFGQAQQYNGLEIDLPYNISGHSGTAEEDFSVRNTGDTCTVLDNQCATLRGFNFPFNLSSALSDEWKYNLPWDSHPYPSEMSTSYSINECCI